MPSVSTSPDYYEITLLRHGESIGNAQERLQGRADYPLTEAGRAQVQALAERWRRAGARFDAGITSPLLRARQTAEIMAEALGLSFEVDPLWVERDVGSLAGLDAEQVAEQLGERPFRSPYEAFGGEGESDWELFLRAGQAVDQLLRRPPGKYLVVSHGGLLNKVLYAILGIPAQLPLGPRFHFGNAGFAVFEYRPQRARWHLMRFESAAGGLR